MFVFLVVLLFEMTVKWLSCAAKWGGARNFAFSETDSDVITVLLILQLKLAPFLLLEQYVDMLASFGYHTNTSWVSRFFRKTLGMSRKHVKMWAVSFDCFAATSNSFLHAVNRNKSFRCPIVCTLNIFCINYPFWPGID